MLIIFGIRVLFSVLSRGTFHCPQCGVDRAYQLRQPRRWFTLFFIPVVPMDKRDAFVECDTCHGRFTQQALKAQTAGQFSHALSLGMRAATSMVLTASGTPTERDITRASTVIRDVVGSTCTPEQVRRDTVAFAPHDTASYVTPLAANMTAEGKENLVHKLFEIGYRLDERTDANLLAVGTISTWLGLTQAHTYGISETVVSGITNGPAQAEAHRVHHDPAASGSGLGVSATAELERTRGFRPAPRRPARSDLDDSTGLDVLDPATASPPRVLHGRWSPRTSRAHPDHP